MISVAYEGWDPDTNAKDPDYLWSFAEAPDVRTCVLEATKGHNAMSPSEATPHKWSLLLWHNDEDFVASKPPIGCVKLTCHLRLP